jgi:hypothetical protein
VISNDTLLHDSSNLNSGPRRSQLNRLVTELVKPLTIQLKEEITSGGKRKRMTMALRSRKSPRVSPSQVSSNEAATVERGTKALKTNENDDSCTATAPCLAELRLQHKSPNQIVTRRTDNSVRDSCSSQQVRRSPRTRRNRPTASWERTEIETAINLNSSSKKIPENHDPSEELLTSRPSNQSVTARNNNNPSHVSFVAKQNAPSWNFESSGMSDTKNLEIMELLKDSSPTFQKRIEELMAFKAKFGHCNVPRSESASNKPYFPLGDWCRRLRLRKGKQGKQKISNTQIECLNALGFQWKLESACDKRIEELRAFKAKFGHCNVTVSRSASKKPYLSLGKWCTNIRSCRRLKDEGNHAYQYQKLSNAQIERLDAIGFQWESRIITFNERIEELRAFKAKFGHCNVTLSRSASNKPYMALGYWCFNVRRCRRLMEKGKPTDQILSKDRIKSLDALGFRWRSKCAFDERIEELREFKGKFGHCNVTLSRSALNKPYLSLARWCGDVRQSRTLCKTQIASLDDVGFHW